MGMSKSKSIANFIQDDILRLWKVPDHMTLEEASTIAAAYATVTKIIPIRHFLHFHLRFIISDVLEP